MTTADKPPPFQWEHRAFDHNYLDMGTTGYTGLDAVFPAIPYCVDLIGGPFLTTNEKRLVAFRPKKK